ncbi:alpha/beta hydrolase-fold protein [Sphingomonas sp.]|uniref:alpha/beta hydrolase n=1 Tax=Sphingomonas sp. TaxID=28214 RepID=UPI0031D83C62
MPKAVLAFILLLAALVVPATAQTREHGRLEQFRDFPSRHVEPRNISVWLPADYDPHGAPYAVIYMQDGQNLFDPAKSYGGTAWGVDEVLTQLLGASRIRRTIVVGIWNTPRRLREYMPARVFERLPGDYRTRLAALYSGTPVSDAYLRFMVHEVKPFIDRRYRTSRKAGDTLAMGSSMGGLISLYAMTQYPQVFGGAACLSSHWPLFLPSDGAPMPRADVDAVTRAFEGYLRERLPRRGAHRLWFDHGDRTLDRFYAPFQQRVDRVVESRGWIRGRDFESRFFPGAAHDERSWHSRLDQPLLFMLGQPAGDRATRTGHEGHRSR